MKTNASDRSLLFVQHDLARRCKAVQGRVTVADLC
jgi:hypothetical protein